jgi:hypothetical protein
MDKQLKNLSNQDEKQNKSTNIQTILELQNCLNVGALVLLFILVT